MLVLTNSFLYRHRASQICHHRLPGKGPFLHLLQKYVPLNKRQVTGEDEDDEAEIAEVDRVRADSPPCLRGIPSIEPEADHVTVCTSRVDGCASAF
jgi:hypothetical protein